MVKMRDLVKKLEEIQNVVCDAGVILSFDGRHLRATSLGEKFSFKVVRLTRPSVAQIQQESSPDSLLVLNSPSAEAIAQVRKANHIVLPDGGFRIVAPGLVLVREAPVVKENNRQVRLRGASGAVAETLLLGAEREWSVSELAAKSGVSIGLTHRVLKRLEKDELIKSFGSGPGITRRVINSHALAQIWRDEDMIPQIVARGYLYGATLSTVIARAAEICPQGAMGGIIAANYCEPTLTNVPAPVRFWAPSEFSLALFEEAGLEITDEGANIEIAVTKSDSWKTHRISINGLPSISCWRAWMELGEVRGRIGELSAKLLHKLQKD